MVVFCGVVFFFFKQKTAYEMRISDWSSDVCSSDLPATSALRVDRAPQVGPCARVEALVEEVAQVNPGFAQQGLEETATFEPEQPRRDGAAVLGGDEIGRASCRERVCQYV